VQLHVVGLCQGRERLARLAAVGRDHGEALGEKVFDKFESDAARGASDQGCVHVLYQVSPQKPAMLSQQLGAV